MELIEKLNRWSNEHTNVFLDTLRIGLGLFLFLKGIQFGTQTEELVELINARNPEMSSLFFAHYIVMTHFAGGVMIAFGLLTRLALVIQFPLILAAVIINFTGSMETLEFVQASIALILTSFFIVYGSGKHSVDYVLKLHV